jgi:uncharacterized protein YjdB
MDMKKKSLFAIVGGGLSLAMAAVAIGGFAGVKAKAVHAEEEATIYSEDFTSWTSDASYNVATETSKPSDEGVTNKWLCSYAGVATSGITGNTMKVRAYKSSGNHEGYFYTNFSLAKVTSVGFNIKAGSASLNQKYTLYYKTSAEGTWTSFSTATYTDTTVHAVSATLSATGEYATVYLKFVLSSDVNTNTKYNYDISVDDIVVKGMTTVVVPTAVSVSLDTSSLTSAGATATATATVTPANATDATVTWSSSNKAVADVNSTGKVTAISNGTANIIATCNAASSVTNYATVTVSGLAASTVYDKVLVPADSVWHTGSYPTDGTYSTSENVVYNSTKFYNNGSLIQAQTANGVFYNASPFASTIKDVIVNPNSTSTATFSIAFGASANAKTDVHSGTAAAGTYTPTGSYSYFVIYSPSATLKIDSIVIELVDTDVEAARTWATNFLSATNVCDSTGAADNVTAAIWTAQSDAYTALSANAKTAITTEACLTSVTNIQLALARYKYIVNKYGTAVHANFLGITVTPAGSISMMTSNEATAVISIAIVSVLGLLTLAGVVVLKKKHN